MPRCCSVVGCKSNYRSEKGSVTTFAIPKCEPLRTKWLQNIPTDLSALKAPVVCIKHFPESDIIRIDSFLVNGIVKEFTRKIPKLKEGSIPSVFHNVKKYSSTESNTARRPVAAETPNANEVAEVQKKWKNFRDHYTREKRYLLAVQSGNVASKKRKYLYFDQLSFLDSVTDSSSTPPKGPDNENDTVEAIVDVAGDVEETGEKAQTCKETPKKKKESFEDQLLSVLSASQDRKAEEDEDKAFFMSVLPGMKKMNPQQKVDFRMAMLSLIKRFQCQNPSSQREASMTCSFSADRPMHHSCQTPRHAHHHPHQYFLCPTAGHTASTNVLLTQPNISPSHPTLPTPTPLTSHSSLSNDSLGNLNDEKETEQAERLSPSGAPDRKTIFAGSPNDMPSYFPYFPALQCTRRRALGVERSSDFTKGCPSLCGTGDVDKSVEYEAVGVAMGAKLKRMDSTQALYAEPLISKILSKGLSRTLTPHTDVHERVCVIEQVNHEPSHSPFNFKVEPYSPAGSEENGCDSAGFHNNA